MQTADSQAVRIQILAMKDEAETHAITVAQAHAQELAGIARSQGCEAMLVCPAPALEGDRLDLIVAARFAAELDEDTVFWRQLALARSLDHELRAETLVLDFDGPLGFLTHIAPMLAAPYRDEIGRRPAAISPRA